MKSSLQKCILYYSVYFCVEHLFDLTNEVRVTNNNKKKISEKLKHFSQHCRLQEMENRAPSHLPKWRPCGISPQLQISWAISTVAAVKNKTAAFAVPENRDEEHQGKAAGDLKPLHNRLCQHVASVRFGCSSVADQKNPWWFITAPAPSFMCMWFFVVCFTLNSSFSK